VLDADPRFGPRVVETFTTTVVTSPGDELAESTLRVRVHAPDAAAERRILGELASFLATHPETAGRTELTYERPCSLHLCRRTT
jgi:hypothetical protein